MEAATQSHPVKWGTDYVRDEDGRPIKMTKAQAERYGRKHMDQGLAKVGFTAEVSLTNHEMHGGEWFRINVVKTLPVVRRSSYA